jgi:hypothetical protein
MGTTLSHPARLTDRIALSIQIRVFGAEGEGRAFSEEGRTLEVSRHGAMIIANRNLTPLEEISIRRELTGKKAPAQIVGQVRKEPEGFVYGVRFLDSSINLWDIDFLPLSESERAVGRTLLECAKCRLREVVYLEEFEAEVYYANRSIYHPCKRCLESTVWNEAAHEPTEREPVNSPPPPAPPPEPAPAPRTTNERRHMRINCKFQACIRYKPPHEEDVLEVDDISRGGICFTTHKHLAPGTKFEIAMPYSPGNANIFVPAEIVRLKTIPDQNLYEYGAAYVKGL